MLLFDMIWYDSDEEEDDTAELMRELERIKKEREEEQAKRVCIHVIE